jgi:hypothetical protein
MDYLITIAVGEYGAKKPFTKDKILKLVCSFNLVFFVVMKVIVKVLIPWLYSLLYRVLVAIQACSKE